MTTERIPRESNVENFTPICFVVYSREEFIATSFVGLYPTEDIENAFYWTGNGGLTSLFWICVLFT